MKKNEKKPKNCDSFTLLRNPRFPKLTSIVDMFFAHLFVQERDK